MRLQSLDDVFADQIEDLHSAETQLSEALPRIAAAAGNDELRQALQEHSRETQEHISRLGEIFTEVGIARAPEHRCEAMAGLLAEGENVVRAEGDPVAKDVALIAAAQRVEHYEIAAYGTARTLADELGHDKAKDLLGSTLDEESNADKLLTKIATGGLFKSGITQEAHDREAVRS